MQEFFVDRDERGQRLDKYLRRRLPLAPSSFIYKMLRKKNITLQGKKADGSEKVETGDRVVLFLSDETIAKFSFPDEHMDTKNREREKEADTAYHRLTPLLGPSPVLYEDENILIIRKPKGILSQKAAPSDLSMNEWLRGYLQQKGETGNFSPAVCNRLDRNTGGILLCARSLQGSRDLSALIRDRKIIKTYTMAVHGSIGKPGRIDAGLVKDRTRNQVRTADGGGMRAVTVYRPIQTGRLATLTEADLITGRSHQLRVFPVRDIHLFRPLSGADSFCGAPLLPSPGWMTASKCRVSCARSPAVNLCPRPRSGGRIYADTRQEGCNGDLEDKRTARFAV